MIRKNILTLLFLSLSLAVFCQVEIEEVSVINLADINTENDEFVAVPYGEGIMFNGIGDKNPCDTCGYFNSLRFAKNKSSADADMAADSGSDCSCSPSEKVSATAYPKKSNFNAPTFTSDRSTMYLTQNFNRPGGGEMNVQGKGKKLKIVMAEMSDLNSWTNFKDVPFNMVDYETAHPALTADGQTMYFTSDRPGGLGKMDIWKVTKEGDTWGEPTNLGAPINSPGNEIFPSVAKDGGIYYSSNKSGGAGNLDVYSATMQGGSWTTENLGAPFNSSADDLGYVENSDGESGYITSNRAGGKGNDDIYCWKVNKAPVKLLVEDDNTKDRLPGSTINIVGAAETLDYVADGEGGAEPDMTYRRTYTVNVEKEGYLPWSKELTAKELAMASPYIVPLVPRAFSLGGDVKYIESLDIAPGSKVVLHNITTGEKREVIADKDGLFTFDNIYCFEDYELIAYDGPDEASAKSEVYPLPASAIDCSGDEKVTVPLKLPEPAPIIVEKIECPIFTEGPLSLPTDDTAPKAISALGNRPQFGNSHDVDAAGFYNKLQDRYNRSARDKKFLDELFTSLGYPNGFADANESTFYSVTIPNGMTGNMGYTKRHRMKYVQLNARKGQDLEAFKVASINACDVYFMKTCGNLFYFKQ